MRISAETGSMVCWVSVVLHMLGSPAPGVTVEPMPQERREAVMPLPGMCSMRPAGRWDAGIVTGNGIMGASVLGQPYAEKVILNHERLFRPRLTRTASTCLFRRIRRSICPAT